MFHMKGWEREDLDIRRFTCKNVPLIEKYHAYFTDKALANLVEKKEKLLAIQSNKNIFLKKKSVSCVCNKATA